MNKALRYGLLAIVAVVLIVVAAAAIFVSTFDVNRYKPDIVKAVKERTGRNLAIDGSIKLTLFPKLGAEVGAVKLSERNSQQPFAELGGARAALAVMPLLRRQLVVDEVSVRGLRASLVRDKDGTLNFRDLLGEEVPAEKEKKPAKQPPPGPAAGAPADFRFDIEQVVIEDASISWRDLMQKTEMSLSKVNLKTGRIAPGVPSNIGVTFRVDGAEPKTAVEGRLQGRLTFDLDARRYQVADLVVDVRGEAAGVSGLALTVNGDVDAQLATQQIAVQKFRASAAGTKGEDKFDVQVDAPRLNLTQDSFGGDKATASARVTRPDGTVVANFVLPGLKGSAKEFQAGPVTLDVDLKRGASVFVVKAGAQVKGNLESKQFALTGVGINLDGSGSELPGGKLTADLKGEVKVDGAKPGFDAAFSGSLMESRVKATAARAGPDQPLRVNAEIDRLDLDRFTGGKAGKAGEGAPKADAAPGKEEPLDLAWLKDLKLNGRVTIGVLKAANLTASDVRIGFRAGDGTLTVDPLAAGLYQGTLAGQAVVKAAEPPVVTAKQTLAGVQLGPLLKDATGKESVLGTARVNLDLNMRGPTVSAMKRALAGNAAVQVTDGAIKGINLAEILRNAQNTLKTLQGKATQQTQSADASKQTDFTELKATFNIKDGVAHNNDLDMKSPALRLGGEGQIDIAGETLDYLAKATVVATKKGQGGEDLSGLKGVTVPVRLHGAWADPKYDVDYGALAKGALKQQEEKVKSKVEEKLGDKLKGLFR